MAANKDPRLAQFAQQLLAQTKEHPYLKPLRFSSKPDNSLDAKIGRSGVKYSFMFRQHQTEVVLYLDTKNKRRNEAYFDQLAQSRKEIEYHFKDSLDWRRQDGTVQIEGDTKVGRVRRIVSDVGYLDDDIWPQIQASLLETMERLHPASIDHVADL